MNKIENLKPFPKFCCSIGYIPTSYKVSMTYEDQLWWLCDFLENTVIPTVNQNGQAVEELQNLYVELKNYVDNYFENLDVQNEINNKLDEMAESGQLAEIIAQYLQLAGLLCFNTVNDMKNATNLVNGSFVKNFGFHNIGDKGQNIYKIRNITNTDIVDNITIISINTTSDLVAELIESPVMYVEQYGAYGDGIHDDTNSIQYAINKHLFGSVHFSEGTYLISSPIKTYIDNNKQSNIIMEKTTIIKTNTEIECLFELGGLGGNNDGVKDRMRNFIGRNIRCRKLYCWNKNK